MALSGWLIAISVFVIVLCIALGVGWWLRNRSIDAPSPPNAYTAPLVWGKPVPGPNTDKNTCQLYEFPTSVVDISGTPTAVPGAPSLNPTILDELTGSPNIPLCLDPDQSVAQQVQHTCTAPNGVVDGSITRCLLINGGSTGLSGVETYYSGSLCANVPACAGVLSLISLNFQAPANPAIMCIQNQGNGNNAIMQACDPSNAEQLFRVTLINPGQNPNALQPGQGQNGIIGQILDRNTGLCLMPGSSTTSTIYNPASVPGCTGSTVVETNTNVVMSTCTGGSSPGYVWLFLPSVEYCPFPAGCSPTGNQALVVPPQIVYIDDLDVTVPLGPSGYSGYTGSTALVQWLLDNQVSALYYGGEGTGLVLIDLFVDSSTCAGKSYATQYMSLTAYNTISQEIVCFADTTVNCFSL